MMMLSLMLHTTTVKKEVGVLIRDERRNDTYFDYIFISLNYHKKVCTV